mgnify:CR=1 FL=1
MATITYVTHDGEDYPAPVMPGPIEVVFLAGTVVLGVVGKFCHFL